MFGVYRVVRYASRNEKHVKCCIIQGTGFGAGLWILSLGLSGFPFRVEPLKIPHGCHGGYSSVCRRFRVEGFHGHGESPFPCLVPASCDPGLPQRIKPSTPDPIPVTSRPTSQKPGGRGKTPNPQTLNGSFHSLFHYPEKTLD